ncbi:MAG TPA: flagellar motor switch protein FliM [Planctomycetota bacterium]|nr:flagellar motor switch protein FliM [Planctomycetota bacterium]
MSERLLTLPEIDALLATFRGAAATASEADVSTYDLDTPSRAPRAAVEGVVVRHEQAARACREELSAALNVDVDCVLEVFEQVRFGALRDQLPATCCAFLLDLAPLREPALLVVDHAFAYAALDRLLGGKGDPSGEPRDLTSTEAAVLEDALRPIVAAHVFAWQPYVPLKPGALRAVPVPRFIRELKPEDVLFSARYRLRGFAEGATVRFATPAAGLEPHLQREPRPLAAPKDAGFERDLAAHLAQVVVGVRVRVGDARLTLRELVHLEKDDVIVLDRAIHDGCELAVSGAPKYSGWLGQSRGRLTYRVRGPVQRPRLPKTDGARPGPRTERPK